MNLLKFSTLIIILCLLPSNLWINSYNNISVASIKFNSARLFDDSTVSANWSDSLKTNNIYKWKIQKMDLNDYWNNTFYSINKFLPFIKNQNSIKQSISLNLNDNPPHSGNLNDNWSIFFPINNWADFYSSNTSNQLIGGLIIFIVPQTVTNKSTQILGSDLISINYNKTLNEIQRKGLELNYNSSIIYFSKTTKEEHIYSWEYDVFNNVSDRSNKIVLINITLNYDPLVGLLNEFWLNIGGTDHTDTFYLLLENNSLNSDTNLIVIVGVVIILVVIALIIYYKTRRD